MQTLPANGPTQARDALLGRSLLTTCVAGCTAATILASPVLQADDSSVEQPVLQQVIVTGSRIERSDTDTPSPVQVITSQQIANSGLTSISDVLHALTSDGAQNIPASFAT